MSAHRRPTLISRSARPRRIPALQARAASTLHADQPNVTISEADADAASIEGHEIDARALANDAEAGPSAPEVVAEDGQSEPDDAGKPVGEHTADLTGSAVVAPPTANGAESSDSDDYADYVRSVEEAAARSRAQQRRKRSAAVAPTVVAAAQDGSNAASAAGALAQSTAALEVAEPLQAPPRERRTRPSNGHRAHSSGGPGGPRGPRARAMARREPDPRPRWRKPKTWFLVFAALVGVASASVAGYAGYIFWVASDAYDEIHQPLPTPPDSFVIVDGTPVKLDPTAVQAQLPNWDNQDPFNILLLGIDERPDDEEPPRSDTIIVARVFPATKQVTMMSIPRDLQVTIPGVGDDKINAAYPIAEFETPGSGPGLVMSTISYNFDIRIDYYMTIDFNGFRDVVDTLGGIVLDVRAPIKDDLYPTENYGVTRVYFPTGLQKMDGETALRYARTRHGDNDIARGDRQQEVLEAIRAEASTSDLITQAADLIGDFKDTVRTDLDANQLLALGNLGRSIEPDEILKVNLWEAGVITEHEAEFDGDAFYWEADWEPIYDLMATYFDSDEAGPPLPTATIGDTQDFESDGATDPDLSVPVIIQNASGFRGVAASAVTILEDAGFALVTREGTSEYSETTTIYDYAESPATAQYIAAQFGLDESSIVYGSGGNGIVVEIGDDIGVTLGE